MDRKLPSLNLSFNRFKEMAVKVNDLIDKGILQLVVDRKKLVLKLMNLFLKNWLI